MGLDYSQSGVDRNARAAAKKAISVFSKPKGMVKTPYNDLFPLSKGQYYLETTDSVGTKVLLSQLAGKHWLSGWEAVACVVNDVIRCGAAPLSITDTIEIADSSGPELKQILEGISKACTESGCFVAGGETADVRELLQGASPNPYIVIASCFGAVSAKKIINGKNLKPGDSVIGLESSGVHANGISLVRKALFSEFGGAFDSKSAKGKRLLDECLAPTRLYVKPFLSLAEQVKVKAAVNITGDSFLKFDKLQAFSKVGFELDQFKPQGIFREIRQAGGVDWQEMFKTFNMGWGFVAVVAEEDEDAALGVLKAKGVKADVIGKVVKGSAITVEFEGKRMVLKK